MARLSLSLLLLCLLPLISADRLGDLSTQVSELQTKMEAMQKENTDSRVVFSVSLFPSGEGTVGPGSDDTTLLFKHVFTNIGEHYNVHTGVFTAPLKGLYSFDFFVHGYSPVPNVWLKKNSEYVLGAYENHHGPEGTSSSGAAGNKVYLQLESGDVVSLTLRSGYSVHDSSQHMCTFSGRLLWLL